MIIWSRWGFLSFLAIGVGVGVTALVSMVLGLAEEGTHFGAMVFTSAALVNFALARWVYPRLDKPRPVTVSRPLDQPQMSQYGTMQTHEVVPVLDLEGRQLMTAPRSSLFFIPVAYVWAVFAVGAVALWVVTIVEAM